MGEPIFAKLNQAFPAPKELFNKSLLTELLHETEFCSTKYIPLCDPGAHTGTTFLLKPHHDLPSLDPVRVEMESFFSSTSLFKSPTPRPLCFGEPMLAKLNQAFPAPKELFNKSLLTEPL